MKDANMKRIIVDFDNTLGISECDVDDGLALLYLMGCGNTKVEGICTTHGNSTIDAVHDNTRKMIAQWNLDFAIYRGGAGPLAPRWKSIDGSCLHPTSARGCTPNTDASEAACFIAETLAENPGDISILATGSMTNLGEAQLLHPGVLAQAASIDVMGGVTQSLAINGKIMDELNLSVDPDATMEVLNCSTSLSIATAQNCLSAFFTRKEFERRFGGNSAIYKACEYWFEDMERIYGLDGWVCWDVVAAAHMMHPELFVNEMHGVSVYRKFIAAGYLECDKPGAPQSEVYLPRIVDAELFKEHVFDAWTEANKLIS